MLVTEVPSLAHRIGASAHLSPLLQKARRLGVLDPRDLESIALARGLRYFGHPGNQPDEGSQHRAIPARDHSLFTDEELALALINPAAPYSLTRIRMAAALLAADGISAATIIRLARQERCESVVRHIARCGNTVEPENPFWHTLLQNLPDTPPANPDALPHISRFVALSGITRNGRQNSMQWIRPIP
jgi:hypothetical protein